LFRFHCTGFDGEEATISVLAVDWSVVGDVSFSCNDNKLACLLLSNCRSDSAGFFNLLAGTKPMYIEQWLDYLREQQQIKQVNVDITLPDNIEYSQAMGFKDEEIQQLLPMIFKVGGFNRLQLNRYLKQRNNPATLSTRYGPAELQRYRLLNDIICLLNKLRL
jgi:hypothetical protein